ncbi:hypothetical protein [Bartonella quintana]|uniref:hypothetical protein n=1 Tax=Bartonella quintana TaxID=803 RepID=UPI0012495D5A|nr:hypothetical protein [Bartonella quintana]
MVSGIASIDKACEFWCKKGGRQMVLAELTQGLTGYDGDAVRIMPSLSRFIPMLRTINCTAGYGED